MQQKILGMFLVSLYLGFPVFGCDYRLLDSDAEVYNDSIWLSRGRDISTESIRDSLSFLEDDEDVEPKYFSEKNFYDLIEEINKEIKNNMLIQFSRNCSDVYTYVEDITEKAAIYMLLEKVREKFIKSSNTLQKIREIKGK